ncbi:hypothetical protein [Amycolatopsis sp. NPDC051102]|uniref:hypothetical protein n=1 Tax=Amycolatopsis sp. NPDC051102 TaxID=3155163 RepID=UPI003419AD20
MTALRSSAPIPPASPAVMQAGSADPRRLVVVGASGNVGTSAVAWMLDAVDAGSWRTDVLGPLPVPDVLVAGVPLQAMTRAKNALLLLSRLGVRPVLVVVNDGHGRPPADSSALLILLRPLAREVAQIPYVPAWRACTSPGGLTPPTGPALQAVNRLRAVFGLAPVPSPKRTRR